MQKFVNIAPWDHEDVQAEVHAIFAEDLVWSESLPAAWRCRITGSTCPRREGLWWTWGN